MVSTDDEVEDTEEDDEDEDNGVGASGVAWEVELTRHKARKIERAEASLSFLKQLQRNSCCGCCC